MTNQQLHLSKLIKAICHVLESFNFPMGSFLIERAASNYENDLNNVELLSNLKEELTHIQPLTSINLNGEMRHFIQALMEGIQAANEINKKFVTRSIDKLYYGFEPFAKNEIQRSALIEMMSIKEDVLGVELRHRISEKLKKPTEKSVVLQEGSPDESLHMTRELQTADY